MIDFGKVVSNEVTKEFVLSKIDDATIFCQYFGAFEFKKVYRSVFSKDKNPSTGFYISKTGIIKYSDFRTRENWDCFSFIAKLYNISYAKAIEKVAIDFGLVASKSPMIVTKETFLQGASIDKSAKEKTIIQIVPDRWEEKYLAFWRVYDITKEELIKNGVYPVKELYINKKRIYSKENIVRFAFRVIYKGEEYMKIYSPHDKTMKWISNIPLYVPFGLDKLERRSDTIIITKSLKDVMSLRKLFTDVIATQNESEAAFSEELQDRLLKEYTSRIIFWDNDKTGVESCKKFNNKGFGYFNIPREYYEKYKIKDASDYISYFGVDALRELFIEKDIISKRFL